MALRVFAEFLYIEHYTKFSKERVGVLSNFSMLLVSRVASTCNAWAAINRSLPPIICSPVPK